MIKIPIDSDLFRWIVEEAFAEKGMVREFDRLWETSLSTPAAGRAPIEILVDKACGRDGQEKQEHDFKLFLEFVEEYIYNRLVQRHIRIYPGYA